jgi:hypothetical protein
MENQSDIPKRDDTLIMKYFVLTSKPYLSVSKCKHISNCKNKTEV